MHTGLAAWHRYMQTGDTALLAELIAPDAMFHSPVVHTPQEGHAKVARNLRKSCRLDKRGAISRSEHIRAIALPERGNPKPTDDELLNGLCDDACKAPKLTRMRGRCRWTR